MKGVPVPCSLGLGFLPEELELPLSAVSGGQRTRVLLAKMPARGAGYAFAG